MTDWKLFSINTPEIDKAFECVINHCAIVLATESIPLEVESELTRRIRSAIEIKRKLIGGQMDFTRDELNMIVVALDHRIMTLRLTRRSDSKPEWIEFINERIEAIHKLRDRIEIEQPTKF